MAQREVSLFDYAPCFKRVVAVKEPVETCILSSIK
jgi:hypothetical protein